VSRKLIEAQEAERTRIARELHDDINQRLAILAINLKTVKQDLSLSEAKTSRRIEEACAQVSGLENDIQALSHRLHSSGLEYLGLEAAVSGCCRELSEQQNLAIHVRFDGVPQTLPHEVSLCLFRVLQEAVHNAVKYSGVRDFEVSLTGGANEIELFVHDSGIGFDPEASRRHGLGLTSMRERLRLVNGQLSIESKPQHGTTILARVPLNASVPLDPSLARITTTRSERRSQVCSQGTDLWRPDPKLFYQSSALGIWLCCQTARSSTSRLLGTDPHVTIWIPSG